jgi:hypothetical protein
MKRAIIVIQLLLLFSGFPSATGQGRNSFSYSAYNPITIGIFANFTYPSYPIFKGHYDSYQQKTFKLTNGIFEPEFDKEGYIERMGAYLKSADYADVAGDAIPEAIIVVGNLCDCSGVWYGIYVYDLKDSQHPHLLWAFQTGDRADGGLYKVYGKNGSLVVELLGAGSGPGISPDKLRCATCAEEYTRRRYTWNGHLFIQKGKAEIVKVQ